MINPFKDFGIISYEQFKNYTFLMEGDALLHIRNKIRQQIYEFKNNTFLSDRCLILGERGLGKTSALFFIKQMLEEEGINVLYFTRFIENNLQLMAKLRDEGYDLEIGEMFKKPIYILLDFPDTIELASFKKFLIYLWELMSSKDYSKINFIFSMNNSHYDKSFTHSEILGKFQIIRLERFDYEETIDLINSRLKMVDKEVTKMFSEDSLKIIFKYSKGIPRNIISACNTIFEHLCANDNCLEDKKINSDAIAGILKEKYYEKVIADRTNDPEKRKQYEVSLDILKNHFNGVSISREEYIDKVKKELNIGYHCAINLVRDLIKFGIFTERRAGKNRTNKTLSIVQEDLE